MTPVRRLVPLFLVVALASPACSGGGREIARVGDTTITLDDIAALYASPSAPAGEEFRDRLFRVMAIQALRDGYEEYLGHPIDQGQVDATLAELLDELEAEGLTIAEAMSQPGAGEGMLRMNVELEVIRVDTTNAQLADPEIIALAYEDVAGDVVVCVRHILTETEEELDSAVARIEAGEDFGAVAAEVSLDVSAPNGDLGCSPPERYVEPFADASLTAPVGELYYPVTTTYGSHAIVVGYRGEPTLELVGDNMTSFLSSQDLNGLWTEWFNEVLQAADAEVTAEQYGSWSPVGIEPPEGE